MSTKSNLIKSFILRGSIQKLSLGAIVDTSNGSWISSIDKYSNGVSKHFKCNLEGLIFDIGIDCDKKIEYMVVHLKDQYNGLDLQIGNSVVSLVNVSLDKLLVFFNNAGIKWNFKSFFEKVIMVLVVDSHVEFVFSYYPNEETGLQILQIASRTN